MLNSSTLSNPAVIVLLGVVGYMAYKVYAVERLENVAPEAKTDPALTLANAGPVVEDTLPVMASALTADELLPKYSEADEFVQQNPVASLLKEQNFLISGYHVGVNTIAQSNKIPYHDIRSLPPIPKQTVGPWNQTTIDTLGAASTRRFFEIGA